MWSYIYISLWFLFYCPHAICVSLTKTVPVRTCLVIILSVPFHTQKDTTSDDKIIWFSNYTISKSYFSPIFKKYIYIPILSTPHHLSMGLHNSIQTVLPASIRVPNLTLKHNLFSKKTVRVIFLKYKSIYVTLKINKQTNKRSPIIVSCHTENKIKRLASLTSSSSHGFLLLLIQVCIVTHHYWNLCYILNGDFILF